jgi:hypothetical protein
VNSDKWTSTVTALALDREKGVIASGDLDKSAQKGAVAFLTAKKDKVLKVLGRDFSVRTHGAEITNEGRLTLDVLPTEPGSPASWESPTVTERFQLKVAGKEVEVKFLDAKYQP